MAGVWANIVEHDRNGLIVKGRDGTVSWMDESVGLLREDYSHLYESNPIVVQEIVDCRISACGRYHTAATTG